MEDVNKSLKRTILISNLTILIGAITLILNAITFPLLPGYVRAAFIAAVIVGAAVILLKK